MLYFLPSLGSVTFLLKFSHIHVTMLDVTFLIGSCLRVQTTASETTTAEAAVPKIADTVKVTQPVCSGPIAE